MKNSLFKRAVAAAAAVPLALTQCLTASFAVNNDAALIAKDTAITSADTSITLENLCYIDPAETKSSWNLTVAQKLGSVGAKEGTIDISGYIGDIESRTGEFGEILAGILNQINDNGVKYSLESNLDLVITAETGNVVDVLASDVNNSLAQLAQGLAEKYGVAELAGIEFGKVDASGTITITVGLSELNKAGGKTIPVKFNFNDGAKDYNLEGALQYVQDKIDEIRGVAYDAIDDLPADKIDADAAKADVDKKLANYEKLVNKANGAIDKVLSLTEEKSATGTFADVIALVNEQIAAQGISKQLPATGSAIAANETFAANYNKAVAQAEEIAAPVTIDIEAADLGAFADALTNVSATITANSATLTANFEDAEYNEVVEYYAKQGKKVVSSEKLLTVTADYANAKAGEASVTIDIERILELEDIITSSSSTSSTTSTTTTTTTSTTTTKTPDDEPVVTTVVKESYVEVESTYGFYLNIDEEFNKAQVESATYNVVYEKGYTDAEGNVIVDENGTFSETYDILADVTFGSATPANTYTTDNDTFKYDVALVYSGAGIADKEGNIVLQPGSTLKAYSGDEATVTAYIGVKGDVDLNNMADPADSSLILVYNAALTEEGNSPATVKLSNSALVTGPASVYDHFAAFLGDVTHNASIENDWNVMKGDRLIDSTDASAILVYNGNVVSGDTPDTAATWLKCVQFIH